MTHAQAPVFPPALGQPGFLAELCGIGKKNLTSNGEDLRVGEGL